MTAVDRAIDNRMVLAKATTRAGKSLGLRQDEIADILGRDRSVLSRGIDPNGKAGELALLPVRVYRSLFVLVGDDGEAMRHWMQTENHHTGGVPADQMHSVAGLVEVVGYLDAIRGKL